MINIELKKYIEECIFPNYKNNDLGHGLDHIYYVINRIIQFAKKVPNINFDMVYTIATYHDIGHYVDSKNHEQVSSIMLLEDYNLKKFFSEEELKIMADAIFDHRASLKGEPRSVYGKIVSSADRNTSINVVLMRTYEYRKKHNSNQTLEQIIEESRKHILDKFGKSGYAKDKIYFEDKDYETFLKEICLLAENKNKFKKIYMKVNGL